MDNIRKTASFGKHGYTTSSGMLSRMAAEDEQAWIEFDAKYRGMIYTIGKQRGLSQTDCEDLMQNVLLVCCRQLTGQFCYDRKKGRFRSWLATVARNLIWQQQRNQRQIPPENLPAYDDQISQAFMKEYEQFLLASCLKLLRQRVGTATYSAFEMLCLQRLPTKEVSRITRKSPAALYLIRYRCLRILRQCIGQIPEAAERIHSNRKS